MIPAHEWTKSLTCNAKGLAVGLCLNAKETESRGARRMMKVFTAVASIDYKGVATQDAIF
jgi:hypothetical protein